MEKYLQELIQSHNRIIIPDFGAFIVSRDNGQHILFNNFLTFNDGLLVSHICEMEGVNSDEALKKVRRYIEKINLKLSQKGIFHISEIGTLIRDAEGHLSFEPEKRKEVDSEVTTVTNNQAQEKEKSIFDDNDDLLDLDVSPPAPDKTAKSELKPPVITTHQQELPKKVEPTSENKIEKENKVNTESEPTLISSDSKKRTLFPKWIWLILLLLIVGIIGVLSLSEKSNIFQKLRYKSKEDPKESVNATHIEHEAIALPIDSPSLVTANEKEIKEEAAPKIIRQHHVIVGSFKNKNDATKLQQKLVAQGLKGSTIVDHQGKFLVSANWYTSVSRALRQQEQILGTYRLENWILSIDAQK